MIAIDTLPSSEVNEPVYRVILSRYPQIHLFERVSNPQDWDVLYAGKDDSAMATASSAAQ